METAVNAFMVFVWISIYGVDAIDATSLICEGRSCCKFYAAEYQNARGIQCLRLLMPEYAAFSNALESSVLQGVHERDTQQDNISAFNPTREVVCSNAFA